MTTPGPWAVSPTKHRTLIVSAQGFWVAEMQDVSPEDAALMASAPALLAALQTLADAVDRFAPLAGDWPELAAARADIANATGGQP
jgi:hypothetical protein